MTLTSIAQQVQNIFMDFVQALKMVILAWYFYKNELTCRSTNLKKIGINYRLQLGVKIGERGSLVAIIMKAATFCQVFHPYMHNQTKIYIRNL